MKIVPGPVLEMSFEPALYPRRYVPSRGWMACLVGLGLAASMLALAGLWYFGVVREDLSSTTRAALLMACCLGALAAAYRIACLALAYQIRLTPHSIEYRGLLRHRSLRRDQIATWHFGADRLPNVIELIPRAGIPPLKLGVLFRPDPAFHSWFAGLARIDRPDHAIEARASALGPALTPARRRARVERARRTTRLAFFPYLVGNALLLKSVPPDPLWIAGVLSLPWILLAVVWLSGGLFNFTSRQHVGVRADLTPYFLVTVGVLVLLVMKSLVVPDWPWAIAPGIGIGVALCAALALTAPGFVDRVRDCACVLVVSSSYGIAAVLLCNALWDPSPGSVLRARTAWGDGTELSGARVAQGAPDSLGGPEVDSLPLAIGLFRSTAPGEPVCLEGHPGAFRLRSWTVVACQLASK